MNPRKRVALRVGTIALFVVVASGLRPIPTSAGELAADKAAEQFLAMKSCRS